MEVDRAFWVGREIRYHLREKPGGGGGQIVRRTIGGNATFSWVMGMKFLE
jgi:hypothetical protein